MNDVIRERERPEPSEARHRPPAILQILFGVVLGGAVTYYLAALPRNPEGTLGDSRSTPALSATPSGPRGDQIFASNCAACHQATGTGLPGTFPPLQASEWVLADAQVASHIVLYGVTGDLKVKGVAYSGQMPPFAATMKDDEIAAVLTYIRSQWGNQASAVATAEVAAVRQRLGQRAPWAGEPELRRVLGKLAP